MKKVFLIPHAGGLNAPYINLGNSIPGFEFEVLNFKGRGHSYFEFDQLDFEKFIEMAYQDFRTKVNDDFVVIGHSFGALIGLELFKRYKKEVDAKKALLITSSFTPPTKENLNKRVKLSQLSNKELLKYIETLAPIQDVVKNSKDSLDFFLNCIRGDFSLLDKYGPLKIEELPFPIVAICGDDDISARKDLQTEWSLFTSDDFELKLYPGKHFELFSSDTVKDKINDSLTNFFGDKND